MNPDARRLEAALDVTMRAGERLRASIEDDRQLLEKAVEEPDGEADKDLSRALDAFVQRFRQLHEHFTHRLFPAIYRAEEMGERPPPFRDLLLWLEGLGVIDSAQAWGERMEIRNRLIHEYPLEAVDRMIALRAAISESAAMLEQSRRASSHITSRRLTGD